ncbi:MAG: outer membrane protein assembly factor BamB, partial [Hylemonella sp.]
NGERIWSGEHLRWRHLGAPLATPRALLVPDRSGLLHFVSPKDGSLLARVRYEGGAALAAPPVLVGSSIVTVSRTGQVQAWRIAD